MYEYDCDKVKLLFASNTVIFCNVLKYLVTIYPYNSPKSYISKYLVVSGGAFTMVINAWHGFHYEK